MKNLLEPLALIPLGFTAAALATDISYQHMVQVSRSFRETPNS